MQATNKIRDRTKPLQSIQSSVFTNSSAGSYQMSAINTYANTSFFRYFSSISKTMSPTTQYSEEERVQLMKKTRCFSCKKRGHTANNYPRRGKLLLFQRVLVKAVTVKKKSSSF